MYNVLIVDDESIARVSLLYLIDWTELGFQITAEASNGEQALDILKKEYFSLVITDVRMPVMDGLSFIEKLRTFSNIPVIILSGYEDFEYARQAMKMGVNEYLLKPVDEDELIQALNRMKQDIQERLVIERRTRDATHALKEQFLRKWSQGLIKSAAQFADELKISTVTPYSHHYICILFALDQLKHHQCSNNVHETELMKYAIRNIIEEKFEKRGYVFEYNEQHFGLIYYLDTDEQQAYMTKLEELKEQIATFTKVEVNVGVGSEVAAFSEVVQSFAVAKHELEYQPPENDNMQRIKQWIEENYARNISLREIANEIYMNPVYLGQLFKTNMGMGFNEYLLRIRMEKAIQLLLHSDKKVYEIAYEVGYKQLDWFYKKFKSYTGISASEYRSSIVKGR